MTDRTSSHPVGVDADLDVLVGQVEQVRALAADPDGARDTARIYDVSIRWGAMMAGRFRRLALYDDRGRLDEKQRNRYHALCADLQEQAETMEHLGLARPDVAPSPARPRSRTS